MLKCYFLEQLSSVSLTSPFKVDYLQLKFCQMAPGIRGSLKFLAGIIVGFSFNYFLNLYQGIQCIDEKDVKTEQFIKETIGKSSPLMNNGLKSDLDLQLPESYKPKNIYDIIRYEYMSRKHMYGNFDDDPKIRLLGHHKNDINRIVYQALSLLQQKNPGQWMLQEVVEIYRRLDPQRGEEYSLILNLTKSTEKNSAGRLHHFDIVKPFNPAHVIKHQLLDESQIYIIVPVSNATNKLKRFLKNFENVCLQKKSRVVLVVVSFLTDKNLQYDLNNLLIQTLSKKYGSGYFRYIHTFHPFSRGFAIDLATKELPNDNLLFFCDVDITFTEEYLRRCRANSIYNKQVFYPVVFAQYHPKMVQAYSPSSEGSNLVDINKSTGHWVHYGYGIACMYAGDYRLVGGFDLSVTGWGGEDVKLYGKHIKSQLKVFRAMDPGLIHIYHDKSCDPSRLTHKQYRMCQDARAQGIGSRPEIAKHLMAQNCSFPAL